MEKNKTYITLAWVSLVLAIISWLITLAVPAGLDLLAVVLALIALIGLNKADRKMQRIAWAGLIIGLIKLAVAAFFLLWVLFAFWKNPVAH